MPNNYKKYNKTRYIKDSDINRNTSQEDNVVAGRYPGFKFYFTEALTNIEKTLKHVSAFEEYIQENVGLFEIPKIIKDKSFLVDLNNLLQDKKFNSHWSEFQTDVVVNTSYCLACMGLGMNQKITTEFKQEGTPYSSVDQISVLRARVVNHQPILQLKDLKINYHNKLVSVRGTVIRASRCKLLCQYLAFECSLCRQISTVKQEDGVYTIPDSCQTKGCRSRSGFSPQLSSLHTHTINCQVLKLQELVGLDQDENGRVPRTVDIELTENLACCCIPGDDITVAGILKVRNTTEVNNRNKQSSIFQLYIDTVSVVNEKSSQESGLASGRRITFNSFDYYAIRKIHAEKSLFRLLVQSLCPTIYGHELVKAGLLLGLFGGTQTDTIHRYNCHILLEGDPGLGKSQLLQACTNVAPIGVYVCGASSTTSGLTVTLVKESTGEYALVAGALVLADRGCCIIDEFDKVTAQHACLLEVMAQQRISIAKAGVMCNIPTHTSILAAANPKGGHFNKAKSISENLNISTSLLSRFDLIFLLLDQPNEQIDVILSEHVLALHSKSKSQKTHSLLNVSSSSTQSVTLEERLKLQQGESIDRVPTHLFRKYLAYAQKYVHPCLSKEAQAAVKQFYLELRKKCATQDSTPVTVRQLESLVRLTQARAKLELREEATAADVQDVIEIMRFSLYESNKFEAQAANKTQKGTRVSTRKQVTNFLNSLRSGNQETYTIQELREHAEDCGISQDKFSNTLETLNLHGYLLKKPGSNYKVVNVD